MNKSSCQASHGNSTSHGSIGMSRYPRHIDATIFTQRGARRNCCTYGPAAALNLSLKVDLDPDLFFKLEDPGVF